MPANDSPIWYLLRLAVLGGVTALLLSVLYQNGFQADVDLKTVIGVIVTAASYDGLAAIAKVLRDGP